MKVIEAEHITKSYWDGSEELSVLRDINLSVEQGEFVCISGKSGCGKSTLLHLLGLLDKANSGQITIQGRVVNPGSVEAPKLRNKHIGFVFQFHYLLEDLNALENVALPLMISGTGRKESLEKARLILDDLDISNRARHYPHQLSGGEQQRIALGRAMINNPAIILADEPTGNLDPEHSREVIDLFVRLSVKSSCAFILVTHDLSITDKATTYYILEDGILKLQK